MMRRKLAILMPIRDEMTPETRYALDHHVEFPNTLFLTVTGQPVDVARNDLLTRVLALPICDVPEYVAFIDADAFWLPGSLSHLIRGAKSKDDLAFIFAICSSRRPYSLSLCSGVDGKRIPYNLNMRGVLVPALPLISPHMVVVKWFLLKAIAKQYAKSGGDPTLLFAPTEIEAEDEAFFHRQTDLGAELFVDPGLRAFHIENGYAYAPGMPSLKVRDGKVFPAAAEFIESPTRSYGPAVDNANKRLKGSSQMAVA